MRVGKSISAAIATHEALETGIHGVGSDYLARIEAEDAEAVNRAGDIGLGATFKRGVDNSGLNIWGGKTLPAVITLYGKEDASFPGCFTVFLPNAAKDALVTALRITGVSDTPEMAVGRIPKARIPDFAHGVAEHTNVTRELFIPAVGYTTGTLTYHDKATVHRFTDGASYYTCFTVKVPDDFVSFTKVELVWLSSAASGNMYWKLNSSYGALGEIENLHNDNPAYGTTATGGVSENNVQEAANPLTLADLAAGDYLNILAIRDGTHGDDTLGEDVDIFGVLFTYTAEQ